jgi:UrcA family protein
MSGRAGQFEEIDMPRPLPLVCASALLLAAASPSFAQEAQSEVVRFADLDLDDIYDADELIVRIHRAAGRVCGARTNVQPVVLWAADRDCQAETTEWTVRDLGHPVVLARYYGVTPRVIIEEGSAEGYPDESVVAPKY